jgi:mutual gliding-motility protein MglA
MVFFNYSTMQMAAKVVYYGPGLCGKTTNLHFIYGHTTTDSRGEMVSLETETDRTLFFDLLPLDVGSIAGFNTRIQLYTVPGQVFYNTTRKLVLKGVDGVVFVVDSQRAMLQANLDSFRNLEENLGEMGLSIDSLPLVLQYNKRDLAEIYSVDELNQAINRQGWPWYEASAVSGHGVFETLKGISKFTLLALKKRLGRSGNEGAGNRLSPAASPGASSVRPSGAAAAGGAPAPPSHLAASAGAAAAAPQLTATATSYPPTAAAAASLAAGGSGALVVPAEALAPLPPLAPATPANGNVAPGIGSQFAAAPSAPVSSPALVTAQAASAATAAKPAAARPPGKTATGKSRSVDVLSELEKLRREAMQPAGGVNSPAAVGARAAASLAAANSATAATAATSPAGLASLAALSGSAAHKAAAGNGRTELSRNIEMSLKRADFARARRFLVSFQVEDDQHHVVDAVRDLQVEIKGTGDASIEKLLLRLNIALHAKE